MQLCRGPEGHLHLDVFQEPQYKIPTIAHTMFLDTRSAPFLVFPISGQNTIAPFLRQKFWGHQGLIPLPQLTEPISHPD